MKAEYIITNYNSIPTTFLLEDGRLVKACPLYSDSILGNVYTAKVVNIVKSINAAFLDVGTGDYLYYSLAENEGKNIFLRHGNTDKVCMGDEILVQISRDPVKSKKGVASADIVIKGDYVVINRTTEIGVSGKIADADEKDRLKKAVSSVVEKYKDINAGLIVRTSAEHATEKEVAAEAEKLLTELREIITKADHLSVKQLVYRSERSYIDEIKDIIIRQKYDDFEIITDIEEIFDALNAYIKENDIGTGLDSEKQVYLKLFSDNMTDPTNVYNLKSKLEKGMAKTIHLKSGGSIVVEPTEAMTVIDVNTGKAIRGKQTEKTFLKINIEAATEIARILRLRNISGIVMIDFINMKEQDSLNTLVQHFKSEIAKDEVKVNYVDMTALGLVELTRKKTKRPLTLKDFSL